LTFWLCLSVSYIALLPKFYLIFDSGNRYTMLWSRAYHMAILAAIVLLAGLYWFAQAILRKAGVRLGMARWADVLCMLWVVFLCTRTVFALLVQWTALPVWAESLLWSPWLKLLFYVLLPVPILSIYTDKMKWVLKRWLLALSVLLVVFLIQSATWTKYEKYEAALDPKVAASKMANNRNILVFIMDEWSFDRTFGEPNWGNRFPAISNLLNQSTLYEKAHSLGPGTPTSIPRLLFSNDEDFKRKNYREVMSFIEEGVPHQGKSIYDIAPKSWLKVAVGLYVDYPVILSGYVDHALKFESENVRRTFLGELRHLIQSQFAFLRIFGIHFQYVTDPEWFPQMEIHQYTLDVLRENRVNIMGVFHYGWPHYPYIWTRQGRKPGSIDPEAAKAQTLENYMGNLEYMDVALGEICATLKESGKWEDALVIFTGDHTWRFDSEILGVWPLPAGTSMDNQMELADRQPMSKWTHVPLIIKYPGQKSGRVEATEVVTHGDLQHIFHAYVQGEGHNVGVDEGGEGLFGGGEKFRTEERRFGRRRAGGDNATQETRIERHDGKENQAVLEHQEGVGIGGLADQAGGGTLQQGNPQRSQQDGEDGVVDVGQQIADGGAAGFNAGADET